MSPRYPAVSLTQPIDQIIRNGHPWIFADALRYNRSDASYQTGDVVDVVTESGDFVGRGVIEPDSPIRVRVWTTKPEENVNNQLLEKRIKAAARRRPFPTPSTNGFRLLNGEGDRLPGVTCDIYDRLAVLRIDGAAAERWIKPVVRIIKKILPVEYVAIRRAELYRGSQPAAVWYDEKPPENHTFTFLEYGLTYVVDPIDGQKTGFFLDQRANRALVANFAVGRRLLNLFSYTAGFSLAAAAAGAAHTTSVDIAAPALADARRNFERNGIPAQAHEFVAMDVFRYLEQFEESAAPFEIAVCDPPSFVHKREDLRKGTETYIHLFASLLSAMPDGSRCALASCSSMIDRGRFLDIVREAAARSGTKLVQLGLWGADCDHPTLVNFTEGDYLQFLLVSIDKS